MKTRCAAKWILLIVPLVLAISCSATKREWERARSQDTRAVYETFLRQNPNSEFSGLARKRIGELKELDAWKQASIDNSISSYEEFLRDYSQSGNTPLARSRIEDLRRAANARIEEEKKEREKKASLGILQAAMMGDLDKVRGLIATDPRAIIAKDESGQTALHFAAHAGKVGQTLIVRNEIVTRIVEISRDKPFKDLVDFLISAGAEVNAQDSGGQTPLHVASSYGNRQIIEVLLNHKAVVNARDENGQCPVHLAAREGHPSVVELLLEKGANVQILDSFKMSPFHHAAIHGRPEIMESLLKNRGTFNLNCKDDYGYTPLDWAVDKKNVEAVRLLLENGAMPSDRTLNLANAKDNKMITEMLERTVPK